MPSFSRRFRSPGRQPYDRIDQQGTCPPLLGSQHDSSNTSQDDDQDDAAELKPGAREPFDALSDIELEDQSRCRRRFWIPWSLLQTAVFRWWSGRGKPKGAIPFFDSNGSNSFSRKPFRRSRKCRWLLYAILAFFAMLGVVQFFILLCGVMVSFFPDDFDRAVDSWGLRGEQADDLSHWPTDSTRDITPVGCHSHNDYWRRVPLYSALQAGCIGVEADVWLVDEELYVGHTESALTPNRTLRNLYINPLVDILEKQNPITQFHKEKDHPLHGVFDTDPSQTLVLLVDFKTDGPTTWPYFISQLSPLRDRGYLTYFDGKEVINGPITVVATGEAPFDLLTSNSTYRDVFFDAPLDQLADEGPNDANTDDLPVQATATSKRASQEHGQGPSDTSIGPDRYNPTNSYYASVSFKKSIGFPWRFHLSSKQMDLLRAQIRGAHRRGLKARYWGIPSWPRSLRNHIWSVLGREGVDLLNVDDLRSATRKDWRMRPIDLWF